MSKTIAEALLGTRVDFYASEGRIDIERPLEGHQGWRLGIVLLVHEGDLRIAELKIFPDGDRRAVASPKRAAQWLEPSVRTRQWSESTVGLSGLSTPSITTAMLRDIRLGEIIPTVRAWLETHQKDAIHNDWARAYGVAQPADVREAFKDVLAVSPVRDRETLDDRLLWAARYLQLIEQGSRSPRKDLAGELGTKPERVRDALNFLRNKGYLTGPSGPRAGGRLTSEGQRRLARIIEERNGT